MPRPPASRQREERQQRRIRIAQQWGAWLTAALKEAGLAPSRLADLSDGAFNRSNVSHWQAGDVTADPDNALIIAKLLGRDPVETLRAAGHDTVADAVADRPGRSRRHAPPAAATTWSAWVQQAAKGAGYTPERIAGESDGTLTEKEINDWWGARTVPTPTAVILVCAMLGADHLEGLRAAGEGELADQIHALALLADPAVRALDRYDLAPETRRRLIREFDRNRARGQEQAAEILLLKAAQASPVSDDDKEPTPDRGAL